MLEKNQELIVKIDAYGSEGQGIARVNNFVVFVPFALLDEEVKVHIIKVTKTYAVGKVIEIIKASKDRVVPRCSIFGKCGGCSLQHASYSHTLEIKKSRVFDALTKIGGFINVNVKDVIASNNEYNYRNKSAFPLVINNQNKIEFCMYRRLTHEGISIRNCDISQKEINIIAKEFVGFANNNFSFENLQKLRNLVIRVIDNCVLVTIVSMGKYIPLDNFFEVLKNNIELINSDIGLFWCKKKSENNVVLDGEIKHLNGINVINANILGVNVEVSPMSFFQVNLDVMKKLYTKVIENIKSNSVVVDAYSGAGLMSACLSKKARNVYGIEIIKEATCNADALKKQNNIENLTNINGDVSVELPKLLEKIGSQFTLVLDPPRKGVDIKVINTIKETKPSEIIYVSCDPASLARDLKFIVDSGYEIQEIQPFDMFPQTSEVETFVRLTKI